MSKITMSSFAVTVTLSIALVVAFSPIHVTPDLGVSANVASACCGDSGGPDGVSHAGPERTTPAPYCTITASDNSIRTGGDIVLHFSSTNAVSASISGIGSVSVDGQKAVNNLSSTRTFTMTVRNAKGVTATCKTTVTVTKPPTPKPTCTVNATPVTIDAGDTSIIRWNTSNANSVTLTGYGSVAVDGNQSVNPSGTKTYTLTAKGAGGSVTCKTTITVRPQPQAPSCTIEVTPASIERGDSATVSWTSINATEATLSSFGSVAVNGSRSVAPQNDTTYTLTVRNAAGQSATCSDSINVDHVETVYPSCSIYASPTHITRYDSATLTWNSSNAHSANLSGYGSVDTDDYQTVSPDYTTTYTLTVYGSNGQSRTCSTTIYVESVVENRPSCWITINRNYQYTNNNYNYNAAALLTWSSTNATGAYITPSVGSISTQGSMTVYPANGQIYTMTVYGPGGTATCSTQANILPPVVPPTPYVTLTQIPYTGLDLGLFGNIAYWLSLVTFAGAASYLVLYFNGGALATLGYRRRNVEVAMPKIAVSHPVVKTVEAVQTAPVPEVKTVVLSSHAAHEGTVDTMKVHTSHGGMPQIIITRA